MSNAEKEKKIFIVNLINCLNIFKSQCGIVMILQIFAMFMLKV